MAIRILDHNGTAQLLSERMCSEFRSELRRIGELPPNNTVINLWVSNQTPGQLLEMLKCIPPARPIVATTTSEQQHGVINKVSSSQQSTAREDGNTSTTSSASRQGIGNAKMAPATRVQSHDPSSNEPAGPPPRSDYALALEQLSKPGRMFNSVYQRETGHIFADPCGRGELVSLEDGRVVNLREEWMKEREREIKEEEMKRKGG